MLRSGFTCSRGTKPCNGARLIARARAREVLHDELERAAVELYDEVAEANTQPAASTSTSTQPAGGSEGARGKRRYAPSPVAGAPKWT